MDMNDHLVSLFVNMQVSRVSKSTNSMMKYRNSGGRDPQSVNVWKEQSITDNASSAIVSALRVPQRSSTKSVKISPQVPTLTSVSWWCACACQATGQMAVVGARRKFSSRCRSEASRLYQLTSLRTCVLTACSAPRSRVSPFTTAFCRILELFWK